MGSRARTGPVPVLVAAAVALLAGCAPTSAAPADAAPGLLVITGPTLAATQGGTTVAEAVGRELGYFVDVDAHPDAGVVDGRLRELPLQYQGGDDTSDPYYDLVLVQAGELDVDRPLREVGIGTRQLLDRLRALGSPRTRIVVVGPVGDPAELRLQAVRDEMRAAALEKQVPFLDPLALGWQADGQLDEQLVTGLRRLGLSADALGS